ncbi:MAG: threonylcarbamoyl-AMP synthase [Bacteroidales bacterium]|nr:threonylcarbamoyl-AMP synthase [Bacteroidales bacterium]
MNEEINNTLEALRSGKTILYPTDTIWGIGCDATNAKAIEKIYKIKKREETKSMLILLDCPERISSYVDEVPRIAYDLIELSEKPVSIIFPKAKNLPQNLINSDGSIGIRVTNDEFCKILIRKFKKPIVTTSANISNRNHPEIFNKISEEVKKSVDYIVNWRQDEIISNQASSIIKLSIKGEIKIIRK